MKKILLIVLLLSGILFAEKTIEEVYPRLSKECIKYYKTQKKSIEEIEKQLSVFDSFSKEEKESFKDKINDLVPANFFMKYLKEGNKEFEEFLYLYKSLINYKAYILVDKFRYSYRDFSVAMKLAKMNYDFFPENYSYKDTYLWSLVQNNKYKIPLKQYPTLIKKLDDKNIKNKEINAHYAYLLEKIKFKPLENLKQIKYYIDNAYVSKVKFDKEFLFKDLDTITTTDKHEFVKKVNNIFRKYTKDALEIYDYKSRLQEQKKVYSQKNLESTIKDGVLYIKPNYFYPELYKDLKKAVSLKKYKKIVIDLKDNEGGSLTAMVDFISAFLPTKVDKLFIIKEKNSEFIYTNRYRLRLDDKTPIKILVDNDTRKGALYVASVLSTKDRATISGKAREIDNSIKRHLPLSNRLTAIILIMPYGFTLDMNGDDLSVK